jgi:hypothetical protein
MLLRASCQLISLTEKELNLAEISHENKDLGKQWSWAGLVNELA